MRLAKNLSTHIIVASASLPLSVLSFLSSIPIEEPYVDVPLSEHSEGRSQQHWSHRSRCEATKRADAFSLVSLLSGWSCNLMQGYTGRCGRGILGGLAASCTAEYVSSASAGSWERRVVLCSLSKAGVLSIYVDLLEFKSEDLRRQQDRYIPLFPADRKQREVSSISIIEGSGEGLL